MRDDTDIIISKHEAGQGNLASYTTGFILSVILTMAPFMMVMNKWLEGWFLVATLFAFALAQLIVQLLFFLHMGRESGTRWNLLVFLFMVLVVVIVVAGSIWIMYNLDYNMMPALEMDEVMKEEAQKGF